MQKKRQTSYKTDLSSVVEGIGQSSDFHADIEAVVAAKKIIETSNHFK